MDIRKQKVYFVRHGETEHNAGGRVQDPGVPLSEKGRKQAEILAERLARLPQIDTLITSSLTRAVETAEIISYRISKPFIISDLFVERRRASERRGLRFDDPKAIEIDQLIDMDHFGEPAWHYSDEENFEDITKRAKEAIEYIKNHPSEVIVVVTHGVMMEYIAAMMMDPDMPPQTFRKWWNFFIAVNNTAITLIDRGYGRIEPEKWKLITWADYAHLSEAE